MPCFKAALWMLVGLLLAASPLAAQEVRPMVGVDSVHVVGPEENLYTIAVKYGLAIEHLAYANNIRPLRLAQKAGTRLIIPSRRILPANPPRNGLVINLAERGLFFFKNGQFVRFYPVSIGAPGRWATPRGTYHTINRVKNPTWSVPKWANMREEMVPPGPLNPLGDRWLGLTDYGLGIHSTNNPVFIGESLTHACIRLYPWQMRELFEKVNVGTLVRIDYETVKLGRDANGRLHLAVFTDVYNLGDPVAQAARVAKHAPLISVEDAAALIRAYRGQAVPLVETAVVRWRGETLSGLPTVLRGGKLWVGLDVLRQAGAKVSLEPGRKALSIEHGGKTIRFPVVKRAPRIGDAAEKLPAVADGARTLVPAAEALDALSLPYRWNAATRILDIDAEVSTAPR